MSNEDTTTNEPEIAGQVPDFGAGTPSMEEQYQALLEEKNSLEDRLLRTLAEFENFRKRKAKEVDDIFKYQSLSLAKGMLPVLSNLKRAVSAAKSSANPENLISGVEMVTKQFEDAFAQQGINKIKTEGEMFDAHLHEALQMMPSDLPEQTIVKELEAGYILSDRVVQPSKVMVSAGPGEKAKG
jgi:molecular chaperone GrpE